MSARFKSCPAPPCHCAMSARFRSHLTMLAPTVQWAGPIELLLVPTVQWAAPLGLPNGLPLPQAVAPNSASPLLPRRRAQRTNEGIEMVLCSAGPLPPDDQCP